MRDQSIPVVRLEVEYMRHAILHAFTQHQLQIDADVKRAVDEFCKPENVGRIISKAVNDTLQQAINEEIDRFYRYGAGRETIRAAVEKRLTEAGKYA